MEGKKYLIEDECHILVQVRQYFGIYYEWNIFMANDDMGTCKHLIQGSYYCESEEQAVEEAKEMLDFLSNANMEVKVFTDKETRLPDFLDE